MTTKILTGTYSAGYALQSPITTLSIAASGYVEGAGIATSMSAPASYAIVNDGRIREADSYLGNAIYLGHGGAVTNGSATDVSARIEGWRGVRMERALGVVTNFGTIFGDVRSGVLLEDGGVVTNGSEQDTGALIEGQTAGVGIAGAAGTVANFGTIAGEVMLRGGGMVTNGSATDTTALMLAIAPYNAIDMGPSGTVTNLGRVENRQTASPAVSVVLRGASLTNGSPSAAAALIYGYTGIEALGVSVIANFGTIEGTGVHGGSGVVLTAGGVLTNGSTLIGSALISGGIGVYAQGGAATVINYGTIVGATDSVKFGSVTDVLIADGGARFVGEIAGGGGSLVVRGPGVGKISGLGGAGVLTGAVSGDFAGFGAYVIGTIGTWGLVGTNALAAGQTLTDKGSLSVNGSLAEAAGSTITSDAGAALTFKGTGSLLAGTLAGAGAITFSGGADTLDGADLTATGVTVKGASVTLEGTIANSGTVAVIGAKTPTKLLIGAGGATLVGGDWALSGGSGQSAVVMGIAAGDTLTVANGAISGAGILGGGQMTLVNKSAGTIDGNGSKALIIDTGTNQIATAGLIEATGAGGVTIQSAVLNGGRLEADGGTLTANGVVRGAGTGVIASGALVFNSTFTENVTFSGTSGILKLAKSQGYTGAITGFSHTGGTSLDLGDIAFVGAGEATFSGTAMSGVLTVTDGTHTAKITLIGDYTGATFTASSDGHGGVSIVDPSPSPPAATHRFIAAAAGLGGGAGGAMSLVEETRQPRPLMLAKPAAMIA